MNPENLKKAAELLEKQRRLDEWDKLLKNFPTILYFDQPKLDFMILNEIEQGFIRSRMQEYITVEREYLNKQIEKL